MSLAAQIAEQAQRVHRDPTDPQKEAGNYRKGHVRVHGLPISIENPKGSYRSGVGGDGKPWRSRLPAHYGYIKRTEGADGDHVDCFVGPHHKSPLVYIVDQRDADNGDFDEHKCFLGFSSPKQVKQAYGDAFSDGRARDRLGHLTEVTVSQFKDWLRNGDTKTPYKRQHGGRIPYAEGGKVTFTDDEVGAPEFTDADVGAPVAKQDPGALRAFGRGVGQGMFAGFADEAMAAKEASGMPSTEGRPALAAIPGYPLAKMGVGAVKYLTGDQEAQTRFTEKLKSEREAGKTAQEIRPYSSIAGEVTGAVPTMMLMPELGVLKAVPTAGRVANFVRNMGRSAQVGAEYGALHGAGSGESAGERVSGAAGEGVIGGLFGAAAPLAGKIAGAAYDRLGRPIASIVRGLWNSEGEAARRLASAVYSDADLILRGHAKGMTPTRWAAAKLAGEPVTLADLGSARTQSLLRSAANTSPEARARIEKMVEDRFLGQAERTADDVRGLVAGGGNAGKTADQLVAEYDLARVPAYKKAFAEPAAQRLWDGDYEQISQAPAVQQAIRMAMVNAKNEAAKMGLNTPRNPFVMAATGEAASPHRMVLGTFKDVNGKPVEMYPNLQFWDVVKKNLDAGDRTSQQWAKILRDKLDTDVTLYKDARGIAANFFGERDALAAGRSLAGKRTDPELIRKVMREMNPEERELFREGYASDLAGRVIGEISQTRDITKAIMNRPNERARIEAIFGQAGLDRLEARIALETFMDGARQAMGNSTTARQLAELGLAGGAVGSMEGAYTGGLNPMTMLTHGLMGAGTATLVRAGGEKAVGSMRRAAGYVDQRTAEHLGRMLTSSDPTILAEGLRIAAKNKNVLDNLKAVATRVALAGQTEPSAAVSGMMPRIQGTVGARGEDEQKQP